MGLIGTGFMGKAHAMALRAVGSVFPEVAAPRCVHLVDAHADSAARHARELGFERSGDDWRALLADPEVEAVSICTPNYLHQEMALAALQAGKHVWCEKPLAVTVAEATTLAAAARASGRVHLVGFNYAVNPLVRVAREIIQSGEIGEPINFSGRYFEDYMASPDIGHSWRCERRLAGSGALADLGSHLVNMLHVLLGPVVEVSGTLSTVIRERREASSGRMLPVENEDIAAVHARLESGLPATMEISRVASGYKCGLIFEVFGSRGGLRFDQERMNELELYTSGDAPGRVGYRRLLIGPEHPDFRNFTPAPGHGLGYNDLKVIEARNFLRAVQLGHGAEPDFDEGLRVQQVMEAVELSAAGQRWVKVSETAPATRVQDA
jgi:predicted dehydrogenase